MNRSSVSLVGTLVALFLATVALAARHQEREGQSPPCLRTEHEKVAFLEGSWEVVSRERVDSEEDRWEESRARAEWTPILGSCALREQWSGTLAGQPIEWIQLLAYDHREEKWQRVMIDSGHGNVITSDGHTSDGKLIFSAPQMREGELLIDRTTVERTGPDRIDWTMETSLDGGKTWITFWTMTYSRRR